MHTSYTRTCCSQLINRHCTPPHRSTFNIWISRFSELLWQHCAGNYVNEPQCTPRHENRCSQLVDRQLMSLYLNSILSRFRSTSTNANNKRMHREPMILMHVTLAMSKSVKHVNLPPSAAFGGGHPWWFYCDQLLHAALSTTFARRLTPYCRGDHVYQQNGIIQIW